MPKHHLLTSIAAGAVLSLSLVACAGTSSGDDAAKTTAASATSAAAFGGMSGLVKAAKAEGQLNVIALPATWANYAKQIAGFQKKYGITVKSSNPDIASAEEITTADNLKGQSTAPDVFDVGAAVALADSDHFAPYKVSEWADIPAANKQSTGLYVNDYTGVMSIGYDADKVPAPTSLNSLLGSKFKGKVTINGDPTEAGAAASAVELASLQSGGSADNIQPGIDFFSKLNKAGNFLTVDPTPATVASGETPVVLDWSYNNLALGTANKGSIDWKTVILPGAALGAYYNQAVNADAPHPAAARLWEEYLYSNTAQNTFLAAGALPVRLAAMQKAGTVDKTALAAVGAPPADLTQLTDAQNAKAAKVLSAKWAAAVQ